MQLIESTRNQIENFSSEPKGLELLDLLTEFETLSVCYAINVAVVM